ncbi:SEC14-like protein 2 isoform X2 [Haemaphysalis longicornis]
MRAGDDAGAAAAQLSDAERAALDKLRQALADVETPSKEDWYLLKWLRARKFKTQDAEKMLREHVAWRKKYSVDSILEDYDEPTVFREYWPGGLLQCSPDDVPVFISPSGQADLKVVSTLVDAVRMFEDNYPEILEELFVINAPSLFPMVWNIIKPLLTQRTIDKIHIFGKEGWREVFAERWDLDRLPAHWGGRLVGPDGDGRCPHLVRPGGVVPDEYRRPAAVTAGDKRRTVAAGCVWTLEVPVTRAGSELRWRFNTTTGDVAFAVRYRRDPALGATAGKNGAARDVVALQRLSFSRHEPHNGSFPCHEVGTYELVFDNSFSWLTSKEVTYDVQLLPPPEDCASRGDGDDAAGTPMDARSGTGAPSL